MILFEYLVKGLEFYCKKKGENLDTLYLKDWQVLRVFSTIIKRKQLCLLHYKCQALSNS